MISDGWKTQLTIELVVILHQTFDSKKIGLELVFIVFNYFFILERKRISLDIIRQAYRLYHVKKTRQRDKKQWI